MTVGELIRDLRSFDPSMAVRLIVTETQTVAGDALVTEKVDGCEFHDDIVSIIAHKESER